ncbi:unnamed protein product, partial [Closterium sp. Naga37s-1]
SFGVSGAYSEAQLVVSPGAFSVRNRFDRFNVSAHLCFFFTRPVFPVAMSQCRAWSSCKGTLSSNEMQNPAWSPWR